MDRARDDHVSGLLDYQYQIANHEPERALALVKEVVRIENHPFMLGVLSAGVLEDLICSDKGLSVIHAVEAEAAASPKFRDVLCGVWVSSADPIVADRILKATGREVPSRRAS